MPPDASAITTLGYALLGEIRKEARGGYALRRLFESTPLGVFSSSPGSIYPALKRLEGQQLIRATGAGRGARFEITALGCDALQAWLARPVTVAELTDRLEFCLLRFAFLDEQRDRDAAIRFLTTFEAAAQAREIELQSFLDCEEAGALSVNGRLAIDHGVRSIRASKVWAAASLETIQLKEER